MIITGTSVLSRSLSRPSRAASRPRWDEGGARAGLRNAEPAGTGAAQSSAGGRVGCRPHLRGGRCLTPAPGGKMGASGGRGLRHPGAQPRPPAASPGPSPRSSLDPPDPHGSATPRARAGVPGATVPLPARRDTHLRRRRHPRAPSSALRKLRPGPLPQPRQGAGPAPAARQSGAAARRPWPIRAAPPSAGWARRKHSRGIPPPRPAPPGPPAPRRSGPAHPAESRGRLYHRRARRGDPRLGPCQSRGRKEASNQWGAGAPGPRAAGGVSVWGIQGGKGRAGRPWESGDAG